MREMGSLSGVEIEPEKQTQLLDASVSMAGVIGGGVPGGTCPFFSPTSTLIDPVSMLSPKKSWRVRCGVATCL
jgi:hypothetical protein